MSNRSVIAIVTGALLALVAACDSGGPSCISPVPTPNACPNDRNTNGAGGPDNDFGGGENGGGQGAPTGAADAGSLGDIFGRAPTEDPGKDSDGLDPTAGTADAGAGEAEDATSDDAATDDASTDASTPCTPGSWPGDASIGVLCAPDAGDPTTQGDAR